MEKIILGRIEKHLKHNAVIRHSQHGFMRGKPCLLNLISFYDKPAAAGGEEEGGVREWLMVWRISVGALNWGVPFLNHDSPIESMPDGSRMDLPLAKAMLVCDSGSTSRITKLNVGVLEQFVKKCSPWQGFMLEKLMEDCILWEGSYTQAMPECEESSPEEEGMTEICHELTPFPTSLHYKDGRKSGVKLSQGRREHFFKIWFYFSLPYSDLTGKKLNLFPQVESVLPMTVFDE
ncbi:uncharacterized protein LOC116782749 [Chiroxiphia lanceolata]|uniref:uncharacterized protein LOC116782749 n=1 Tax=Chiroxiphia lanceolata TaxID=296741 RepID=UPI0013CF3905|nr:uncharacterized protein LOC116782749 [Chiroxiphia lanceolata]